MDNKPEVKTSGMEAGVPHSEDMMYTPATGQPTTIPFRRHMTSAVGDRGSYEPKTGAAGRSAGTSAYFEKPVDRRLSFADDPWGHSAQLRARVPLESVYHPAYPAAPLSHPLGVSGPRGRYEPLFESVPRYPTPAPHLPSMEQMLFSRATQPVTVPSAPSPPRPSRLDLPRRSGGSRRTLYGSPSHEDEEYRERVPILRPKEFDGKGSWTEFIRRFNTVALANNWSYVTKGDQLKNCLVGEAGSIVHRNPASICWTYDDVVAQVGAVFGPSKDHQFMLLEKLERRKRKRGEALHVLRDDICELVDMAYPSASAERRHAVCVERFIRALDNPKVVHKLLELDPKTLDEAFRAAKLEEATWHAACSITQGAKSEASMRAVQLDLMSGEQSPSVLDPGEDLVLAEVRKLGAMVSDLKVKVDSQEDKWKSWSSRGDSNDDGSQRERNQNVSDRETDGRGRSHRRPYRRGPSRPRNAASRGPITCFRCQEQGHMASDCLAPAPVPKSTPQSN